MAIEEQQTRYRGMFAAINSTLPKPTLIKCWQRVACFLCGVGASYDKGACDKKKEGTRDSLESLA
jgi:hypothetical protein